MKTTTKPRIFDTALNRAEASALRIAAARNSRHSDEHLSNAVANVERLTFKLSDAEKDERNRRQAIGRDNTLRRLGRLGGS